MSQRAYTLLGGPGDVTIEFDGYNMTLTHDYNDMFINIWNNWIAETFKELALTIKQTKYIAYWKDFETLYNEDPLLEKCPYSEFFWSIFSRIRTEYGPEKRRIWTLFTQRFSGFRFNM